MGTAGHIDHGKTALIKALTNFDCDTHKEEKKRGITINLGFTHFLLPTGEKIGIIDVPGHKNFIHTMLSGVFSIDFVLFVIAADSGIMPQSKEHLNILNILGMKKGIVVITKTDLVDDVILDMAKDEIKTLLKGSFLENAPTVEVSSVTGQGINELKNAISIISNNIEQRKTGNFARIYIDRIFSVKGFGNVITGTVLNGIIKNSDTLYLLPAKKNNPLKIRNIERYGKASDQVCAGDRAAINIIGINKDEFKKGMIISNVLFNDTDMVDAKLFLFEHCISNLKLWSEAIFYSGTIETKARIHLLDIDLLKAGNSAMVQIHLQKKCVLLHGDKFIIRNTSSDRTLGGGYIVDAYPLHHKKRPEKLIKSMKRLANDSLSELIKIEVRKKLLPVDAGDISKNLNKPVEDIIKTVLSENIEDIVFYKTENSLILIDKEKNNIYSQKIIRDINLFHKKNPISINGLSFNEIKSKLGFSDTNINHAYIKSLLTHIENKGLIIQKANTWILSNHKVIISDNMNNEIKWIENIFLNYNMQVPLMSEIQPLAYKNKIKSDVLNKYIKYLIEKNVLYNFEGNFIHNKIIDSCRKKLLKYLDSNNKGISISEFRDLVKGNRKICLILIGIFDKEKIIFRKENLRFITEQGKMFLKNIV